MYAVRLLELAANEILNIELAKLKVITREGPLDHMIIMCTQPNVHIPSFGTFSCDIAPVMLDVKVVWLTCEYGTEMVTPLPVVSKHRKLSPDSKGGRPELIVRVICTQEEVSVEICFVFTYIGWYFQYKLGWSHTGVGET